MSSPIGNRPPNHFANPQVSEAGAEGKTKMIDRATGNRIMQDAWQALENAWQALKNDDEASANYYAARLIIQTFSQTHPDFEDGPTWNRFYELYKRPGKDLNDPELVEWVLSHPDVLGLTQQQRLKCSESEWLRWRLIQSARLELRKPGPNPLPKQIEELGKIVSNIQEITELYLWIEALSQLSLEAEQKLKQQGVEELQPSSEKLKQVIEKARNCYQKFQQLSEESFEELDFDFSPRSSTQQFPLEKFS